MQFADFLGCLTPDIIFPLPLATDTVALQAQTELYLDLRFAQEQFSYIILQLLCIVSQHVNILYHWLQITPPDVNGYNPLNKSRTAKSPRVAFDVNRLFWL